MAQVNDNFYSFKCSIASFLATYIAGVLHPLDVIKTRFQSHDGQKQLKQNIIPKYNGIYDALCKIHQEQGFKGLYKGFQMSMLSQAIAAALFFWIYEYRRKALQKGHALTMLSVTRASLQAGLIGTILTQPFWVIKTRMLLNTLPNLNEWDNMKVNIKQIHQQYGFKGFCKGLTISILLSFNGVFQMFFYQGSKIVYDRIGIPQSKLDQKSMICGGISKIFSVLLTYPFTTIRTRFQQNQFFNERDIPKYYNMTHISSMTWRKQGIIGFYKGLWPNIVRGIPQRGIYFYSYELLKRKLINSEPAQ